MDTALTGNFHGRGLSSLQARGRPDRFTPGKRTLKQRSAAEATSYPWGGNWWRRTVTGGPRGRPASPFPRRVVRRRVEPTECRRGFPGGMVGSTFLPAWRDNGTHCRNESGDSCRMCAASHLARVAASWKVADEEGAFPSGSSSGVHLSRSRVRRGPGLSGSRWCAREVEGRGAVD
ncbi:hypothetical protein E1301_Tti017113 [Triplophysa tibetana]|uniref:Uncharacterized protein n=1 Tax=Triplophysa tibetana TaxID=1572043 RepID=A0A5A9P0J4_9TELE|nr:hypothetical protein E1301_Tti017113 [Triplophysa tibetana]